MAANISFYNTSSKTIEAFIPHEEGKVTLYTCGPTVYNFAHIGNLRTYIMEDVLEKFLCFAGYEVKRAMNITDVGHIVNDADIGEDKMLAGAKREHKTVMQIAEFYTDAFFKDCEKLNIKKPEIVIPATSCIEEYISLIERLIERGFAYQSGGNVYFDTSSLRNYYVLVGHTAQALDVAVRRDVEEDKNKRNKTDFVLWFTRSKFTEQELRWNSPWGVGYPGWHIECSAISLRYLGEYLDIHCGGIDNIFPHHTNEIAQSEALIGHKWCSYWFHTQHLVEAKGRMSKSSGAFLTAPSLQDRGYDPLAYRMFCLQSHYRKPLVFSYDNLDNASASYTKLKERIAKLDRRGVVDDSAVSSYKDKFVETVGNDLNTSLGITMLYDILKAPDINDATKYSLICEFDSVLSLDLGHIRFCHCDTDPALKAYVSDKIAQRTNAKRNKDYALADAIRNKLMAEGILLKDTKDGTDWIFQGEHK